MFHALFFSFQEIPPQSKKLHLHADRSLIFCPLTFLSRYRFFTPSFGLRVRMNCEVLTWLVNKINVSTFQSASSSRVFTLRNPISITCFRPHLQRYLHPRSFLPLLLVTCGIPRALCSVVRQHHTHGCPQTRGYFCQVKMYFRPHLEFTEPAAQNVTRELYRCSSWPSTRGIK